MRKYISVFIAITFIAISIFIAILLIKNKTKKPRKATQTEKSVSITVVKNKTIPLIINTTGSITAKNKIELFSEVQGVLDIRKKDFKTGTIYSKGETIFSINADEHLSNLMSLQSNFNNALLSIMADINMDYSSEYEKWQVFMTASLNTEKTLPKLPQASSDQEKSFLTSKNIYSQYYNVKNLEDRLKKYNIKAPYNGIVTEALVNQGTLIRQGQKLGEFIKLHAYELELSVNSQFIDLIKIGNSVKLNNIENTKRWQGKIIRINGKIDQATQTIRVFIEVNAKDLREGMYLEANLIAKSERNALEINRKLLVEKDKLFTVKNSTLFLVKITPVYFNENTVIIKGLKDGTKIISKPVPGAYEGMKVKIKKQK